jgi:hypothetical protein
MRVRGQSGRDTAVEGTTLFFRKFLGEESRFDKHSAVSFSSFAFLVSLRRWWCLALPCDRSPLPSPAQRTDPHLHHLCVFTALVTLASAGMLHTWHTSPANGSHCAHGNGLTRMTDCGCVCAWAPCAPIPLDHLNGLVVALGVCVCMCMRACARATLYHEADMDERIRVVPSCRYVATMSTNAHHNLTPHIHHISATHCITLLRMAFLLYV